MFRSKIEELFTLRKFEEVIPLLENVIEEEYEEYTMLKLGQAYLFNGDEKKSKKIVRRLKVLFPCGEFCEEEDALLESIAKKTTKEYLAKYCSTDKIEESVVGVAKRKKNISSENNVNVEKQKIKKEIKVSDSIKEYFKDVIGLEKIQVELDKFYKLLRFQNERIQSEFYAELIKSTHFVISGERGCGKNLVGEIISNLLYDFGIREDNTPISLESRELVAAYGNDNVDGITKLFENVNDRTIIVENIQYIFDESGLDDVGLKSLLSAIENVLNERKDELSVLFTGSTYAFDKIWNMNTTIEDCFYTKLDIPLYSSIELLKIAEIEATKKALRLHDTSKKILLRKIDMNRRTSDFMNAITLKRYLDQAAVKMAQRFWEKEETTEADMVYLMPSDFEMELEEESLEDIIIELDNLIGLWSVKEQIKKRIQSVSVGQQALEVGASRKGGYDSLHMLFTGNPGTGKTTVARMIGRMYQQLGILPRGNCLVECTRGNLVGQYQGHTAQLVQQRFKEAAGGVLFIDEAYSLCRDENDSFGHEAVDEIIAQMENNRDNMIVIMAGYKKEMEAFLNTNPGFHSRIRNHVEFEDYTVEEMVEIFHNIAKEKNMNLDDDIENSLKQMLEIKSKTPNFGNARGVRNIFEEVVEALDERLLNMKSMGMQIKQEEYDRICKEDIEIVAGRKNEYEKTIDELLAEINGLTGLTSAKQKVQEMVDDLQVKEMMKLQGLETGEHGTLHLIFKGNAGTGKTTVARLLGMIYTKLGILKKNVFVEVSRGDLVANYSGQTATKVLKKIEEAEGGILFIDEVYTLINGENDEFGKEAINTLVAELENRRNNLMVIIAGYGDKIDKFLSVNQGLASRLSNEIVFEDYSNEELTEIFCYMVSRKHMVLEEGVKELIIKMIEQNRKTVKDFGNARGARNMLEKIQLRKNSRIAMMKRRGDTLTVDDFITIKKEDIE